MGDKRTDSRAVRLETFWSVWVWSVDHVPDIQREQSWDQLRDCGPGPGRTAVTACAGPGPASCHKTEGIDIQLNIDLISTLSWLSKSENQNKRVMFMYSLSFSSSYCDKRHCWECSGVIVNACTWMRESWMVGQSECLRSTLRHTRLREGKGERRGKRGARASWTAETGGGLDWAACGRRRMRREVQTECETM